MQARHGRNDLHRINELTSDRHQLWGCRLSIGMQMIFFTLIVSNAIATAVG